MPHRLFYQPLYSSDAIIKQSPSYKYTYECVHFKFVGMMSRERLRRFRFRYFWTCLDAIARRTDRMDCVALDLGRKESTDFGIRRTPTDRESMLLDRTVVCRGS